MKKGLRISVFTPLALLGILGTNALGYTYSMTNPLVNSDITPQAEVRQAVEGFVSREQFRQENTVILFQALAPVTVKVQNQQIENIEIQNQKIEKNSLVEFKIKENHEIEFQRKENQLIENNGGEEIVEQEETKTINFTDVPTNIELAVIDAPVQNNAGNEERLEVVAEIDSEADRTTFQPQTVIREPSAVLVEQLDNEMTLVNHNTKAESETPVDIDLFAIAQAQLDATRAAAERKVDVEVQTEVEEVEQMPVQQRKEQQPPQVASQQLVSNTNNNKTATQVAIP